MGKKRIAIFGEQPKKPKTGLPGETSRKLVKTGKEHGRITDMGAEALAEAERIKEKEEELEKEDLAKVTKTAKKHGLPRAKARGAKYLQALTKVDRHQFYPLPEAIKLLKSASISRFNGAVDTHLVVSEVGLKGEVKFPHPTGKKQNIRIVDEELLDELEKGKINFTTLITTPIFMPKLLKFAKILGPRGLMPNPKASTITDKPEELAKKLLGVTQFRTETKFPLIHMTIGRIEDKESDLAENLQALIEAVGKKNIQKAVLAPTMGPGIKVDLTSL
ncbi:MAG: 50S ribosomal protein L1 [Microgenomates group bacterium LiPW_31]|nr:MAG: 50S ribosomal protein L1 [Microgenomates group bacterium LiPW_31]